MFVVTVSPIQKGFGLEELSYFSGEDFTPGSIISVPVRKGRVKALVIESQNAEEMKAEIRSLLFSLKKIDSTESSKFLSKEWMEAAQELARFSGNPLGSVIAALLPGVALNNISQIKEQPASKISWVEKLPTLFQGSREERASFYKKVIREQFARKRSVFLCLSENEDIDRAPEVFAKGIEKHVLIWKPGMSKKNFLEQLELLNSAKHPVLVIARPEWLFLRVKNLGTIIMDRAEEGTWMSLYRPFIDFRKFAEFFAKKIGAEIIFADNALSAERLYLLKESDPYAFDALNFRVPTVNSIVVEMKNDPLLPRESVLLSPEVLSAIRSCKEKGKNAFIYSVRKGLSSTTVCRDCGTQVLCHNCSSPVVLYKGREGNFFRCHQCGEVRSAEEVCKNCSSWRLLPLGTGVERIREELEKLVPGITIFEINKEVTPTALKARKVAEKFYETPGSVLIGTEMALRFLAEPIDFSIIASVDSLFAIPDFHMREKIFRLILEVKLLSLDKFLIQLRNTEKETVEMALSGNILDFYSREIKEREEMQYPPFSVFVKVTLRGNRQTVRQEMQKFASIFSKFEPAIFPARMNRSDGPSVSEKGGAQYAENAVIKLGRDKWPNEELSSLISTLPPFFEVKVNPDNLL